MSEEDARHKIMQWCIDGISVPNDDSGREVHMSLAARDYTSAQCLPLQELARLAAEA
jgi:hypothetical protein